MLDDAGRERLVENIVGSMTVPAMGLEDDARARESQQRMPGHWRKARPDLGAAVGNGIKGAEMRQAAE